MSTQTFTFEQSIKASPAHIYHAFTNATALREWMCDVSTINPKPGGRLYVSWNSGYYASGEYTTLEKDKQVAFTWNGRNEGGHEAASGYYIYIVTDLATGQRVTGKLAVIR